MSLLRPSFAPAVAEAIPRSPVVLYLSRLRILRLRVAVAVASAVTVDPYRFALLLDLGDAGFARALMGHA